MKCVVVLRTFKWLSERESRFAALLADLNNDCLVIDMVLCNNTEGYKRTLVDMYVAGQNLRSCEFLRQLVIRCFNSNYRGASFFEVKNKRRELTPGTMQNIRC